MARRRSAQAKIERIKSENARDGSGQVDLDRGAAHANGIDRDEEAGGHATGAGGEREIVAVPWTDDRVAFEPSFGERAIFVRAGRAGGIEASIAGVEHGDRQAAALEQGSLADGDLVDLRDLHVGHQRRSSSALSMAARNSSMLVAPITGRPLMRNVGVLLMPSAWACAMSRSTSAANRRSSRQRANASGSRPSSL